MTVTQGFFVEVIATFMLVLAIFASIDRLRADHNGSVALSIGFVVTMDIPWAVSLNPYPSNTFVSTPWRYIFLVILSLSITTNTNLRT